MFNKLSEVPCTLDTILDPTTCVKKGLCPVGKHDTKQARMLYYELHGHLEASEKIVLIMGLNFTCAAWSAQVNHFANKPDHAVLVFDNRGVGNSECGSFEPYRTSEMAKDTLELLNFLQWDQDRSIHILGVSLGGMISQELCLLIPKRIKSVTFISTRSGSPLDFPSTKILKMLVKIILRTVTYAQGLDLMIDSLYPESYLQQTTSQGRTQKDELREFFSTWHNVPRKQSPSGVVGQTCAALFHYCSQSSLEKMSADLSPAKVAVILGHRDEIVYSLRSLQLQDQLPGSELIVFQDGGHALSSQFSKEFNELIEKIITEGNQAFPNTESAHHV